MQKLASSPPMPTKGDAVDSRGGDDGDKGVLKR
jgi:hypothetical protein